MYYQNVRHDDWNLFYLNWNHFDQYSLHLKLFASTGLSWRSLNGCEIIRLESFDSHSISLELSKKLTDRSRRQSPLRKGCSRQSDHLVSVDGRRPYLAWTATRAADADSWVCWELGGTRCMRWMVVRSQVSGGDMWLSGFDCKHESSERCHFSIPIKTFQIDHWIQASRMRRLHF